MENALFWLVVLMCLFVLFMDIIFAFSFALLLFSKSVNAKFERISDYRDSYQKYAYYEYNGKFYRNIFPAQIIMKEKVYIQDAEVQIRIIKRLSLAIDKLTRITIYLGVVSSAFLSVLMYFLYRYINNFA